MAPAVETNLPTECWRQQQPASPTSDYIASTIDCDDDANLGSSRGDSSAAPPLGSRFPRRRSLLSQMEQDSGNRTPWGRTFDSLRTKNNLSKNMPKPSDEDTGTNSKQGLDNSVVVAEPSNPVASGDNWFGTVTIGRDESSSGSDCSLSPESPSVTKKLRHLVVPMTPPRPKKKTSATRRSPKKRTGKQGVLEATPPTSPVLWGDYGLAHNAFEMGKPHGSMGYLDSSPGRTPGKRLKEKFRLNNMTFDLPEIEQGTWEELLGSSHQVEARSARGDSSPSVVRELASYNHSSVGQTPLPDAPPLVTCYEDSFLTRFHAIYPKKEETEDGVEQELDSVSRTPFDQDNSDELPSSDTPDADDQADEKQSRTCRLLRFADEQGLPIAKIHVVGDEHDPYATSRIIVLFLDPMAKKFEFMQGEFSHLAGPTVSDLLKQLPAFATEERFADKEYVSIYGTNDEPREFSLNARLHELDLCKKEIVVAVMKGASGEHLVDEAASLLTNTKIMRAVKKASRMGRGLKYIKSTYEKEQEMADQRTQNKNYTSNKELFEEEEGTPERPENHSFTAPSIKVYDGNSTHQDQIPDLTKFEDFHDPGCPDFSSRATEEEPRRMTMKYLHAALWATIGIAYTITNSS